MMFCVTNLLAARIRERAIFNQNSQELGGERAIFTFNIILISSALPPPQAACHELFFDNHPRFGPPVNLRNLRLMNVALLKDVRRKLPLSRGLNLLQVHLSIGDV